MYYGYGAMVKLLMFTQSYFVSYYYSNKLNSTFFTVYLQQYDEITIEKTMNTGGRHFNIKTRITANLQSLFSSIVKL